MKQKKDKTNIWIDIKTAAGIIGLSEQTLKKQCRAGKFIFKIVKKGKSANYFILLKSLPNFAQDKYFGVSFSDIKYSEAPNWAKQQAEKMYIYDKISLEEIGIRLNISRRTLFYWKKKYEWDRKRFEVEHNQENFSIELLEFARKLMQKISTDIDNDRQTPQSEIYSLMKILKNIPQVKQYENFKSKSKQLKTTGKLTPEIIEQIERDLLRLDL